MTFLPKSSWRYALLIIILFAIVAVAAATIIAHLAEQIAAQPHDETIRQMTIAIWALTMGCLFLAGALGLWAIRSTTEIEGRRRVGRFVDTMDFFGDGLLALDRKGLVRGANPAARQLAPRPWPARSAMHSIAGGPTRRIVKLPDIFPCLIEADLLQLLDEFQAQEIEKECVYRQGLRTLRFRSQPAEGLSLVLVSDITARRAEEIRKRRVAQLQIIGRIASGIAHDFNRILSAISAHALLLQRLGSEPQNLERSLKVIAEETQKGVLLSRQLLELSRTSVHEESSENLSGNVTAAAALLRSALSPQWVVNSNIQGSYPAVPLAPAQIEQVVVNLGLLAADAQAQPGTVTIALNPPGKGSLLDVGEQYAAVILVSGESAPLPARPPAAPEAQLLRAGSAFGTADAGGADRPVTAAADEGGVISSVVRTMVEEAHGRFDQLLGEHGPAYIAGRSPAGRLCIYRVCLPHLDMRSELEEAERLSPERLANLLSRRRILLAGEDSALDVLATKLSAIQVKADRKVKVASILASVEQTPGLDILVMDNGVLGENAHNLLKALRTLRPQLGIVVLAPAPKHALWPKELGIIFVLPGTPPEFLFRTLLEARSAAPMNPDVYRGEHRGGLIP